MAAAAETGWNQNGMHIEEAEDDGKVDAKTKLSNVKNKVTFSQTMQNADLFHIAIFVDDKLCSVEYTSRMRTKRGGSTTFNTV